MATATTTPVLTEMQEVIVREILASADFFAQKRIRGQKGKEAGGSATNDDDADEPKRIFLLTGCAGTGKSTVLRHLMDRLKSVGLKYLVVSSFAQAASHSAGQTIHRAFSIGVKTTSNIKLDAEKAPLRSGSEFDGLSVLFIEEFSTCSNYLLMLIEKKMCNFYNQQDMFFGGQCVIVFLGDLLQLRAPVPKSLFFEYKETDETDEEPISIQYGPCYDCPLWEDLTEVLQPYELEQNFRQAQDNALFNHLSNIRCANLTMDTCRALLRRVLLNFDGHDWPNGVRPTFLYSTNAQVDRCNQIQYDQLPGEECVIRGTISPSEAAAQKVILASNVAAEYTLKIGCQVMVRANIDVAGGICNGVCGVVTNFYMDESSSGPKGSRCTGVYIKLPSGRTVLISPFSYRSYSESKTVTAEFEQIPLTLAWAMTIHKAQGLTIPLLAADLGQTCFEHSQVYVALSRAPDLDAIYLKNIDFSAITVDPAVARVLQKILPDSQTTHMLLSPQQHQEVDRDKMYDFDSLSSPMADNFMERRETHPRTHKNERAFFLATSRASPVSMFFVNSKCLAGMICISSFAEHGFVERDSFEIKSGATIPDAHFSLFLRSMAFVIEHVKKETEAVSVDDDEEEEKEQEEKEEEVGAESRPKKRSAPPATQTTKAAKKLRSAEPIRVTLDARKMDQLNSKWAAHPVNSMHFVMDDPGTWAFGASGLTLIFKTIRICGGARGSKIKIRLFVKD